MIALRNVSLDRRTGEEYALDLKGRIFAIASGRYRRPRRKLVLEGIDLEIATGEKIGIIGPNGAGKSTLLKVIAGVLTPTTGSVRVDGRVAPLIQLSAGFDPDLPVVDNIVLYGVLLGVDRRTIQSRVENILRFAELEEYRNFPVRALSSGMMARLGFAVATDADADVLLVDEALSVGDERFRLRSKARIDTLWHEQRTVLLVSHDLALIRSMCQRVIWLDGGRVMSSGNPAAVVEQYLRAVDQAALSALLKG